MRDEGWNANQLFGGKTGGKVAVEPLNCGMRIAECEIRNPHSEIRNRAIGVAAANRSRRFSAMTAFPALFPPHPFRHGFAFPSFSALVILRSVVGGDERGL